jgi:hypothetical protein
MTATPPRNRRAAPFRPRLEALEERWVPTCTISENAGVLLIIGDDTANQIAINDNGGGAAGNVAVACDNTVLTSVGVITGIRVRSRGGNDTVSYTLARTLSSGQSRRVTIDMGTGQDNVKASLNGALSSNSRFQLNVKGGTGHDRVVVASASTIPANAFLILNLSAGGDFNVIRVSHTAQLTGQLIVNASVSGRYERINATLTPASGSTGLVSASVQGGPGNDALRLIARKASVFDTVGFDAFLNGGGGIDTCSHTSNVVATNCAVDRVVP